jgi:protein involved in polysaccharide export with SLBB domain
MPPDILQVEVEEKDVYMNFGNCLVRSDGTISLHGTLGSVHVEGRTLEQIRATIADRLAPHAGPDAKAKVQVNVVGYNSKRYYVIAKSKEGDQVHAFPDYGGETVVGALLRAGLAESALKGRVWLAIRSGDNWESLEVNWRAITQEGKTDTNYVLESGDRVYVEGPQQK